MTKEIRLTYDDKEWKCLEKAKEDSGLIWKEFIYLLSQLYWKNHYEEKNKRNKNSN